MKNNKICPICKIGYLVQVADADIDVCFCPICEEIIEDYISRNTNMENYEHIATQ